MNINTPTNSRKLSILAQYIFNTDVDKFVKLAESFDTVEQLAKSKQYLRMASLLVDMTPDGMQPSEYVLQVMRQSVPPNAIAVKSLSIIHRLKHLPGKHNQGSHGRKRGGSGGGSTIDLSVEARKKPVATEGQLDMFGMPDTSAGKSVNQQLDEYNTNESARRQRINAAIEELHVESDNYRNAVDEYTKRMGTGYQSTLMRDTDPEINRFKSRYMQARENVPNVIRDEFHNRGIDISNMSSDAQNALFDSLGSLKRNDGDMQYLHQVATTLGLYGNPDLRMRIATEYYDIRGGSLPSEVFKIKIPANRNPQTQYDYYTAGKSVDETYANLSLEMRMVMARASKPNLANNDLAVMNAFVNQFIYTHTSQNTVNEYSVLGASMQTAVSQVGPNRGLNPVRNFWRTGVKPPMPHPEIVAALQAEYDSHQRILRITYPDGYMQLYRGEKLQPGQPYEPFSTNDYVAKRFSQPGGYMRDVRVPIESIFTSEYSPNWRTNYSGESEYLVLGTHFSANTTETPKGTFEWNGKDVAIVSNYSDTSKSYIERLKHLPGKHNQASHGRKRGGSGGGSVIDLPVEARKKPVVADGQLDMFGMLDTSAGKDVQRQLDEFTASEKARQQKLNDDVAQLNNSHNELTRLEQEYDAIPMDQRPINPFTGIAEEYPVQVVTASSDVFTNRNIVRNTIAQVHQQRAAQISNMSADAQNALYDSLDLSESAIRADANKNQLQMAFALGLYGNPDLRMRVAQKLDDIRTKSSLTERDLSINPEIITAKFMQGQDPLTKESLPLVFTQVSLEHRMLRAKEKANTTGRPVEVEFAKSFIYTHTSQNTVNEYSVLGASMQTAVSQVGPNRGINPVRNFWPTDVKPPMPHPEIVAALQFEYETTQQVLRKKYPVGYVQLYRGEKLQPGNPYEPFSQREGVAKSFIKPSKPGYIRDLRVPIENIFSSHYSPHWGTEFVNEKEFLVLGTSQIASQPESYAGKVKIDRDYVDVFSNYTKRKTKSYITRLKSLVLTIMLLYS